MAKIERDEIVKRATELLRVGGYDDTSMAQIADACGIRKASLYHHFPEKDGLILAAIERIHDHFREHIFAIVYRNDADPKHRLHALCEAIFDYFDGREGGCLLGNFTLALTERAPRFQEPLRAYFDDWTAAVAHLLTPAHGASRARELAFDSVAHIQGAIMMMRLYHDPCHLRRALDMSRGTLP
ncbi:MAG: TetR/AcrR family transcriptional regulator [Geminicoccaceae bacterium]|nr:TetR/AcrR family transcriptional regulator [Geminicoccaceae bacterium]MCC0014409.1 TetR/AcrR family transcriptional regulator [Rhodobiaceae bacterium]